MNKAGFISILVVAIVIAFAVYFRTQREPEAVTQAVALSEPAAVVETPEAIDEEEDDVLELPAAIGEDAPAASDEEASSAPSGAEVTTLETKSPQAAEAKRPRLVDLGADKCIPCKKLAPILDALREEYKGKLDIEFIDVWKRPDAKGPYNIRLIPTQILYDASGKEVWRHEGFIGKEDLKKLFAEKVGVK